MKHWSKLPKDTPQSPSLKFSQLCWAKSSVSSSMFSIFHYYYSFAVWSYMSLHSSLRRWGKLLTQVGLRHTFQRCSDPCPDRATEFVQFYDHFQGEKKIIVLRLLFSLFAFSRWSSPKPQFSDVYHVAEYRLKSRSFDVKPQTRVGRKIFDILWRDRQIAWD